MKRKAMGLLMVFIALVPLAMIVAGFFARNVADAALTARYNDSLRAFWAAEHGAARAEQNLRACVFDGICSVSGTVTYDIETYQFSAVTTHISDRYYKIEATGTGRESSRQLASVIQVRSADPGKFENGIETQGDINISGNATINPAGSAKPFSTLDFEDLFGFTKHEIMLYADQRYLNPDNNVQPCDGITYVKVDGGNKFRITNSGWKGSGILVIDGDAAIDVDATITGGKFDGIIYITGELEIPAGNPVLSGTVLVEDAATDITKLLGNLTINYDQDKIDAALELLSFVAPHKIAWWDPQQQ